MSIGGLITTVLVLCKILEVAPNLTWAQCLVPVAIDIAVRLMIIAVYIWWKVRKA